MKTRFLSLSVLLSLAALPAHAQFSFTGLGDLAGGSFSSQASGVSSDGSVVVGRGESASGTEAFRWTQAGGMVGLGDLPGGVFFSSARGVSSDGSVVGGRGESASGEAFRWTSGGGMVGLGDLAGGGFDSQAYGVSSDGSVVVGYGESASGFEAFRWTQAGGMVNLKDFLITNGVSGLTGWTLNRATGISGDGTTIVGYGRNPSGQNEAWRAVIASASTSAPEPGTLALLGLGILGGAGMVRRGGRQ